MQFNYYIASVFNGMVYGTNDKVLAEALNRNPETFVIDADRGKFLDSSNDPISIEEVL